METTKQKTIDQITISKNKSIRLREIVYELENGIVKKQYFHSLVFNPGKSLSNAPDEVKSICDSLWTHGVIADYQASIASESQE